MIISMSKSQTKELKKWSKLITDEINNPLTQSVDITRRVEFDPSFPDPMTTLTIKIKQKARVEDYGNAEIHRLADIEVAPPQEAQE